MFLPPRSHPHLDPDMITARGHNVYYLDPTKTTVDPDDIKIHITNICRYNGAIDWKLIKHLTLCGKLAELYFGPGSSLLPAKIYKNILDFKNTQNENILKGDKHVQTAMCVSHDFHEIYCTDVVSGLKKYLSEYQKIEHSWEAYVHEQLQLDLQYRNEEFVKFVDLKALALEMFFLAHPAATHVAEKYNIKIDQKELAAIGRVNTMSAEQCWKDLWAKILTGVSHIQILEKRRV